VVGEGPGAGRRAVLLVANAAAPYSRGLRVARSLAAAGWDVEIAAVADYEHPGGERDGRIRTVRYRPTGRWARFAHGRPTTRSRSLAGRLSGVVDTAIKVVAWPVHVRGWWATLERDLPPADLYHAFGILAVPVALRLAARDRRAGRRARVIYDVIDVILESNNVDRLPSPVLAGYRRMERRWVRAVDAVVTVNDPIADHLVDAWALPERPTVLLNCQPRWEPPAPRPDHIRELTGIPRGRRIVLFLGRLGRERGLDEAAEAVLELPDAALVLVGFGPWADRLRARDRDPRFAGRHFTLPPVHPDAVPAWTASADVSVIAVPANSLNQRLSTPNKFWESLTAGTPVVVGRDLEVMREIVERERVGAVADPADPADLARALGELLGDAEAIEQTRSRCLEITRTRYSWETAVVPYLALVARITAG
jgi:glycosyltransferase involved in cell wall biosynthesis